MELWASQGPLCRVGRFFPLSKQPWKMMSDVLSWAIGYDVLSVIDAKSFNQKNNAWY